MSLSESMTVPNDQVARIEQEYKDAGATIKTTPAGQNQTTITATFPDTASKQAAAKKKNLISKN